jgi:perosamine synthetase
MIPLFSVNMPEAVDKPLLKTLHSGYITQGPRVEEFESLLDWYLNKPYVVTVNSGTSALTMAFRLAGVGPSDEVITTAMTCSATNLPILSLGAVPVFADVLVNSGNIDPQSIRQKITDKTKAIMVVAWGGMPVDYKGLAEIKHDYPDIEIIEDAAHAFGARYKNQRIGALWPISSTCFSFQAIKHMTTGDGGALVVAKRMNYEKAKLLRWFGINREQGSLDSRINEEIYDWGYKFHMNDINATIGIEQIKHVDKYIKRHQEIAKYYDENLSSNFIKPPRGVYESTYWLYTVLLPNEEMRDAFKEHMRTKDIQVSQVHRRNDEYYVFKKAARLDANGLRNLDNFSSRMVCLPINYGLQDSHVEKVVKTANKFMERYSI